MTRPARTGTARTGTARTGTARTGTARTSTARTGPASGALRTTGPVRATPAAARRSAPVPSRPQLRLVPPAAVPVGARRTVAGGRRAPFVLLVVLMLVATTVSLLLLNTAIAVDSLEASQRRAAIAETAQEVDRLEQEVVTGGTAAALARSAAELGLVQSGAAAHLVLGPDGTSAVRGEAVPAPAPEVPAAPVVPAAPLAPAAGPADAGAPVAPAETPGG